MVQDQTLAIRGSSTNVRSTAASTTYPGAFATNSAELDVTTEYIEATLQNSSIVSAAGTERSIVPCAPRASQGGKISLFFCYELCRLSGRSEMQRREEWR